ncbi:hypothetical protein ACFWYW_14600 [Nonomuraea sp. NPDC059023]|uniref:hypothetical protein n=1 Tax=unclassified Nonomuraea TaxID=2593643 RepID=UPI00369B460F
MAPSRVPAVLDALVARFTTALPSTPVMDGPQVTDDVLLDVVHVGWDGDDDGLAAETTQEWSGLGGAHKTEQILITCAIVCWDGRTSARAVRQRAYALFAAVEAALRSNPGLGLPPPTIAAITTGRLHQEQTDDGALARLPFTVAITTRI